MIRLDFTQESVVIVCETCRVWHGFGFDKLEAWERAAAHEARTHPESEQARKAFASARASAAGTP